MGLGVSGGWGLGVGIGPTNKLGSSGGGGQWSVSKTINILSVLL